MFSQLQVIHRNKPDVFSDAIRADGHWRVFVTCLRSLAISFDHQPLKELKSTDHVYRGEKAYRFLLEVACGLQSPIVGETEVFGQFREFADQWTERAAFFQNIYADVKNVRQAHLSHLGSQSYGSWVRKQVQTGTPIHILGTGQLAQEIYVWLRKQNTGITFYSRAHDRAELRLKNALNFDVTVKELNSAGDISGAAVVVASPLSAKQIETWMGTCQPKLLIDLRDDSNTDRVRGVSFCLQDVFSEIEKGRHHARHKIAQAHQMIEEMVAKRFQSQTIRPFGWDDLCA